MKKTAYSFLLFCFFTISLFAQFPPPCLPAAGGIPGGDGPPGCLLCSPIYTGSTRGYSPTPAGSSSCGPIDNNQFFSAIPGSSGSLAATVTATTTVTNQGIEVTIYDQSFNQVSNCPSSVSLPWFVPVSVGASGLTPGEIYWIMVDGYAGDLCDFNLTVSGNSAFLPPGAPGPMTLTPDVSQFCPGAIACYSIAPVQNAFFYEWEIPGNATLISGGTTSDLEICIEYTAPGGGVVKVTPQSHCISGIPAITPITVLPIIPEFKPPITVCPEEFPLTYDGILFNEAGFHELTYQNYLGCDSLVTYTILSAPNIPNLMDTVICDGKPFEFNGVIYDETGVYNISLDNAKANGCDSLIRLVLNIIENDATIQPPAVLDCLSGASIPLRVDNAPGQAQFKWTSDTSANIRSGANSPVPVVDKPGKYYLELIAANSGCSFFDTIEVVGRTGPEAPVFDTFTNFRCNLDPILFVLDTVFDTDSLLWTFSGVDTFKTALTDSFLYSPIGAI